MKQTDKYTSPDWSRYTEDELKAIIVWMRWLIFEEKVRRVCPALGDTLGGIRLFCEEFYQWWVRNC